MKKHFRNFLPGTAAYVIAHAEYSLSRRRNPSIPFRTEKNPIKALALAQAVFGGSSWKVSLVDTSHPVDYSKAEIPPTYKCGQCGAKRVKLWREYQTFLNHQTLRCAHCPAINQKKDISKIDANGMRPSRGGKTDQIGWYIPAVPTEENDSYWGYTSVPQNGCEWWRKLPTLPERVVIYTTQCVKNLHTGKSFTFEVPQQTIEYFEMQKGLVETGQAPMLGSVEKLTTIYEFSFFPAYKELLKIWTSNGFTTELIVQILADFGVTQPFIYKLLEDDKFISDVQPWFEGITCDGERASRTLKVVYDTVKSYFSPTGKSEWEFFTNFP